MPDRFYHPGPWGDACELEGAEAHHLLNVLRAQPGTGVEIFDGRGAAALGVVTAVTRRSAKIAIQKFLPDDPNPAPEIIVAAAPPKGDRLRWLVEKLTELGADRFVPLTTQRSVVVPSEVKLNKLEQTIIAACKQSGRNRLLAVDNLCTLTELLQRYPIAFPRILFGRCGAPLSLSEVMANGLGSQSVLVVVGPEGGLLPAEEKLLELAGGEGVAVGRNILRVETAAIALTAGLCACRDRSS